MRALPVELLIVAALVAIGAGVHFLRRLRSNQTRSRLDDCDYVVFEALPSHLEDIQADLSAQRWRLASSEPGDAPAMMYRFEKLDGLSTSLSEIFDFERSMPRIANRTVDADFLIRIKGHGSNRALNV